MNTLTHWIGLCALAGGPVGMFGATEIKSPDGKLVVDFNLNDDGTAFRYVFPGPRALIRHRSPCKL